MAYPYYIIAAGEHKAFEWGEFVKSCTILTNEAKFFGERQKNKKAARGLCAIGRSHAEKRKSGQ
ncbi:hypothetical protein AALG83_07065 [Christensenellaceae bacterium 44-20]